MMPSAGACMLESNTKGKSNAITTTVTGKRAFEPTIFDEFDSENIDPAQFESPSKKSKNYAFDSPVKPEQPKLGSRTVSWELPSSVPKPQVPSLIF